MDFEPSNSTAAEMDDGQFELGDQLIEQDFNYSMNDSVADAGNDSVMVTAAADRDDDNSTGNESSFNVTELVYIRSQLAMAKNETVDSGNPTALVVTGGHIAIGTFNGHVLVFRTATVAETDGIPDGKLAALLKHDKMFGSITSLSLNRDDSRLLCGGSRGSISEWNMATYELIRVVDDLHAPFSTVLRVQHLSVTQLAILNDTSGSVFLLDVRKRDFDSQCIFSGSRGETLTVRPLMYEEIPRRPVYAGMADLCLVAMATVSKIIVISVRPTVVVHFTMALTGELEYLPLMAWNLSFECHDGIVPVLAFCRQNRLFIHRMVTDYVEKIDFLPFFQFSTGNYYRIQHICWAADCRRQLFLLDTEENGHLIDVPAQQETERFDLSHVGLVYEIAHYKSLVNGGYVSRAMAAAGQHACNNSVMATTADRTIGGNQIVYLLGVRSVFAISQRNWEETVQHHLERNQYSKALRLLYENYLLHRDREAVADYNGGSHHGGTAKRLLSMMSETLNRLMDFILTKWKTRRKTNQLTEAEVVVVADDVRRAVAIYLRYCVRLADPAVKQEKVGQLYEKIADEPDSRALVWTLIESLEPYIFDDEFPQLSPQLVRRIIDYYREKQWFDLLDSLIPHFEIGSLDVDHIIRIYPECRLYDSFIYIFNCGLNDFLYPFETLLNVLAENQRQQSTKQDRHQQRQQQLNDIIIGNKLLVYLSCMFTGVHYPNKGRIDPANETEHLNRIYERLTREPADVIPILFRYDCVEFLNIILIAFEFLQRHHPDLVHWKQILIDLLLRMIKNQSGEADDGEQKNSFYIFLARCSLDADSVAIKFDDFERMIEALFDNSCKRFEERQQALLQLLEHPGLRRKIGPEERFLERAWQSKMFKICEVIQRNRRDWIQLLRLYIEDRSKNEEVFDYIDQVLAQSEDFFAASNGNRVQFLNTVFENFSVLWSINQTKAMNLFYMAITAENQDQMMSLFDAVTEKLTMASQLFEFLKEFMLNPVPVSEKIWNLCRDCRRRPEHQETFIELACQFEPENIVEYLTTLLNNNDTEDLSLLLECCRRHQTRHGEAFLLEQMKRFPEAFEILFEDFQRCTKTLMSGNGGGGGGDMLDKRLADVSAKFDQLLSFCNRRAVAAAASDEQQQKQQQQYWLRLLEYLIRIKTEMKTTTVVVDEAETINKTFNHFFESLIVEMLTRLNLVTFLEMIREKVLRQPIDSGGGGAGMAEIRDMLLCILENYNYEKTLLELTTNIVSGEHHRLLQDLRSLKMRCNVVDRRLKCARCGDRRMHGKLVSFRCRHLFHQGCLQQQPGEFRCPVCHHKHPTDDDDDDEPMTTPPTTMAHNGSSGSGLNEVQLRILNHFHQGRLLRQNRFATDVLS